MKGFEIQINGKLVCTAGGPENTSLHASAHCSDEGLHFYVNGMTKVSEYRWDHLDWGKQYLQLGDRIVITVVERPKFDAPLEQHSSDPTRDNDFEDKLIKEIARYRAIAEIEGTDAIKTSEPEGIFCSFCGKSREEQPKILAGPGKTYICIECVSVCNDIFTGGGTWPRS